MQESFVNITEQQVKENLSMQDAVALMKKAFITISSGTAAVPLRTAIDIPQQDARALFMPVYVPELNTIGVKIVSVYPHNTEKHQIPNIHGKLLLINAGNGVPYCLMDAEYITALRTGAASGLATDLLANKNATVLAVFGTGAQAITQVQGVLAVRSIEKILVFAADENAANSFVEKLTASFQINAITANGNLLKEADIICTATNSSTPVFKAADVKQGCHINAIGSFKPDMQELPGEIIVQSKLFVDQKEACLAETGDIVIPLANQLISKPHILGELGEVIAGKIAGRQNVNDVTIFKSVGNAVQDVYAAHWVFQHCQQ